jgi:hypothetical protein
MSATERGDGMKVLRHYGFCEVCAIEHHPDVRVCIGCGERADEMLEVGELVPASELRGAVEALRRYGNHRWTCAALASTQDRKVPCDCGWIDALGTVGGQ